MAEALISESNPILDAQMTASSERNEFSPPRYARLNMAAGNGGWRCSTEEENATEPSMFIQVCIESTLKIKS